MTWGQSLAKAMEAALATGDKEAAQCVACECVVLAEATDHSLSLESLGLKAILPPPEEFLILATERARMY